VRLTQQANQRPFHCAVVPFKGNSNSAGFIDTGQFLGDDKVFVSFEGATMLARKIGWVGPTVIRERDERIAALEAENDDLREQLQDATARVDAIDFLGSKDFVVRQKRGPKKKEVTNA
jgi:hypothetical protein